MALPSAVRRQAEEANQRIKELGQPSTANADPEATAAPASTETPTPAVAAPPAATPTPATTSEPEGFQPLTQPLGEDDAKWSQRYQTLQGKYNAEVPRLQARVKELEQQLQHSAGSPTELQQLRDEIARLKQQPVAQPAATTVASPEIGRLKQEYGDDFVESILGIVRQEMAPIQRNVENLGQTATQNNFDVLVQKLTTTLAAKGINYAERNFDPLFLDWLDLADEFSGMTRKALLNDAFRRGDIDRAANIFTAYDGQQTTGGRSASPNLQQHVSLTPSTPKEDAAPQGRIWTAEDIKDLGAKKARMARGLPCGHTKEELDQLEREMFAFLNSNPNA